VWKRLSYFGETLSHSSLLGVALGYVFSINISITVFAVSSIVAILLFLLNERTELTSDSLLGLLSHSSLSIGLLVVGYLSYIRFDMMGLLFGDILAVTKLDILIVWVCGGLFIFILYTIWQSLLAGTVNRDIASSENMSPRRSELIYMILLSGIIAISIKIIGILLITGLLIIPAAMARNISNSPIQMILISIIVGVTSVVSGLFASLTFNTASGPSILVIALILFIISLTPLKRLISGANN
ncbi:MAG: metal ABC transporter permease, partial [Pseudomonadota bacterium]|nr:metal ABC transporter permease [Pseudomonadota bacterium]